VREGEMVVVGIQNQPGTTLMTISDLRQIDAEVKVAEADVLRVAVGQPAAVVLEALPGRTFRGKGVEVGAQLPVIIGVRRGSQGRLRLRRKRARLRPPDVRRRDRDERATNVLTVPLQSVVLGLALTVPSAPASSLKGRHAVFTPVTAGVIGGHDMEVSGLPEGEPVVLGPYQILRDLQDGAPVTVNPRKR
jgi:HlyD family secretion protein